MKWLVDNSVLFPALDNAHPDHAAMRAWLDSAKPSGWGVTVETYLGVIRMLMNPVVMRGDQLKAHAAVDAVRREMAAPHAGKILPSTEPDDAFLKKAQGHRQIMDFYLVQMASKNRAKLATRDAGILAAFPTLAAAPAARGGTS